MRLLTQQRGENLCMLYSFAMCLGVDIYDLESEIGTSTHWQEFIQPCMRRGYIPMLVDFFPTTIATKEGEAIWPLQECITRAHYMMLGRKAVLITESHAVAFEDGIVYDSAKGKYPFEYGKHRSMVLLIQESNQVNTK